ncbi:AAA family ATPase [Polymorphobacter sp.]|uniref:AAA family ATPase n=1 Tax=Polymorphobacter sp. TaxID=1909290 RepID=UPI003F6F4ACB
METGKTLFVTGPNGVGKSGLLAQIGRELARKGANVETFFGNRHIQFQSDDIDQIGQSLEQLQIQLRNHVTRYRHPWGEQHMKSVLRRVIHLQAQATHDIVQKQEEGACFEAAKESHPQILPTINAIFEAARLQVRIDLTVGGLRARRGNAIYGIDRLSDGERAALLLVGAVLIQPANSFILVDEPERHLNPAITGALLAALVRSRSDIGFVFASHDIELIKWLRPEQIIHLRGSIVMHNEPEDRRFDLTLLGSDDELPEELRSAILGSRHLLLLVEGETSSEDQALYRHVYPEWNVVARGGCETVVNGVKALAKNGSFHWLHTAGIIDRDGRAPDEQAALALERIFCLPVPTIENMFLHPQLLEIMADLIHQLTGGASGPDRMAALRGQIPTMLHDKKREFVVKRLVWEANRRNDAQKISPRSVKEGQQEIPAIDLNMIRSTLEDDFDTVMAGHDVLAAIQEIPLKILANQIVQCLGYNNFGQYASSVLSHLERQTPVGNVILDSLRAALPVLPAPNDR